ncbi:ABC transporter substrate-binding protein [Streptomyces cylindrosporus]|uniref:ABC transporter substrate-binding protein n=1 Tax=Streptomyces cylindrosporus TaxID=2927583 RepID=A0ABS9Y0L0_9ACTN|nr:ABC transporter substrate-binding protein [Streptomyces cylindrosporus]MCI3270762.1 ABC transporter substrate-binding protein [Streptomyces cylindrosporus]
MTTRRLSSAAIGLTCAITLGACANSAADSSGASTTGAPKKIDSALGATFSGGKSGTKAKGTPVTIGLVNQQGGAVSNPEFTVAAQAAADYINANLGGIDGHPIKLKTCYIVSSEEQGQVCAQRLLADRSISLILQGGLNVGTQSLHRTIAGEKPVLIGQANPGPDTVAANSYATNASALASLNGVGPYLKNTLKAKKVAIVSNDNAGDLAIAKIFKTDLESRGIKVTYATFPATSTDLISPLTAAGAQSADAVVPIVVTTTGCTALAKAYQQMSLTTPAVVSNLCATDQIKSALGDYPKWIYSSSTLSLLVDDPTKQTDLYRAVMAAYAPKNAELGINAPYGFSSVFSAATILNKVGYGEINAKSVKAAARNYTGPVLLGSPTLDFGSVPHNPTIGSLAVRFYQYEGSGTWKASGTWINAPK